VPIYRGLLISTKRKFEQAASSEIQFTLIEKLKIEKYLFSVKNTGISGLVTLKIDNIDISKLIENLKSLEAKNSYYLHCLKFRPIQMTSKLDLEGDLKDITDFINKEIIDKEDMSSYKIIVEKRHSKIKTIDVINQIAPLLSNPVNLDNPDMILLFEIIADNVGVSWISPEHIFSTRLAFDEASNQPENWFLD
jgi:tRNA acetyltransferase TAN1